jgi:adenylate cyclase
MRINPKTQIQLFQVLAITVFWILCGAFLALYKCVTYDLVTEKFIFSVPQNHPLASYVLINLIGPAIGGAVGGSVLILVLNERLRKRSYTYFLFVNILVFFVFIFALNSTVSYFFYYKNDISEAEHMSSEALRLLVLDPYAIRNVVTWLIIAFITLHGLKIYEKYGPGILFSMFLGRYHHPHEVQRVFMFLDLSNSTTMAEQLGHIKFFSLLRDLFIDITDPILNAHGEIYQYVGDEVVISWPIKKAVTETPHCIDCFFSIEQTLNLRKQYYHQKYGVRPGFKAAVHSGAVVVGEMGVIKREIVYSGDILNTASRMMEQCKLHNQQLIISHEVVQLVTEEKFRGYSLTLLDNMLLRGKKREVEMFGIRKGSPFQ